MKRAFDLFLALCASLVFAIPILVVAMTVKFTSAGPVLCTSTQRQRERATAANNTVDVAGVNSSEVWAV